VPDEHEFGCMFGKSKDVVYLSADEINSQLSMDYGIMINDVMLQITICVQI
jgi:hypothetical protein